MMAYYVRFAFNYIPAVMLWIAFLYMMAIFKEPSVIAGLLSKKRPFVRKAVCIIVFFIFAIAFMVGFGTLLKDTRPMWQWHEAAQYLAIGIPMLFGACLAGAFMVGVGMDTAERVEEMRADEEPQA